MVVSLANSFCGASEEQPTISATKNTMVSHFFMRTKVIKICGQFFTVINFPIIFGTSGHLVGGTFLAVLLGPYAAILSMTIVLLMQAVIFADGGILAFGINVFIMAIIGGLSFYLVKLINRNSKSKGRLASSIFFASWIAVILGAIFAGIMISPAFSGGILMTVPSMLIYYSIIGLVEGFATTILLSSIQKIKPAIIGGLAILKEESV